MKLEVVIISVSDVDRAKEFYARLGWRLDADFTAGDDWRGVQFTPPGSGCSVIFGKNVTTAAPGSAQGLYLAVSYIETTRNDLLRRGVEVSEVFHGSNEHTGTDEPYLFGRLRVNGPDPAHTRYHSFASFHDPDGNGWLLQEVTTRLPGTWAWKGQRNQSIPLKIRNSGQKLRGSVTDLPICHTEIGFKVTGHVREQ